MRLILFSILVFYTSFLVAETVYKTVDEDGNIIFTDKPSTDSEEIELQELQTIDSLNQPRYRPPPAKPAPVDETGLYKTLTINSPADGAGIRDNAGNVSISVSVQPALLSGHSILITMDGKEISKGAATRVSLNDVDRGTHSLVASVVNANGKQLISSSSSFSLLRVSQ